MEYYRKISRRDLNVVTRNFLSPDNVCRIHDAVLRMVEEETGHKIHRQDDEDLHHFMYETLEIYDSYVMTNEEELLRFLNTQVVRTCVERIKNEMRMQSQYTKDASTLPNMIPRAQSTTSDRSIEIFK